MCPDFLAARLRLAASTAIVVEPFGWSGGIPGKCWQNANLLVQSLGGALVYGWALGRSGPVVPSSERMAPLYRRWVNHILWADDNGRLWEVTPVRNELDGTITWEATHFIVDHEAVFEIASDEIVCPRPAIYVAIRPEGEWTADCLCQAERAPRETQDDWVQRALDSIRRAGIEPTSWRVKRVGDKLRDIWINGR